jgi:acyl carrier protein
MERQQMVESKALDRALDELVRKHLDKDLAPQEPLPESVALYDYGLNSAASINLLSELEDLLGKPIPDEFLTPEHYQTLASLRALVRAVLRDTGE